MATPVVQLCLWFQLAFRTECKILPHVILLFLTSVWLLYHFLHTYDSLAILNCLWFPGSIPYPIRCHFSSLAHAVSSAPSSLDGSEIWSVFQHSVYKFSPPGSFSWPASPLSLKFVLKSSSQCSHVLCIQLSEKVFLCVVVCHRLI